jgi:hypothetical protein
MNTLGVGDETERFVERRREGDVVGARRNDRLVVAALTVVVSSTMYTGALVAAVGESDLRSDATDVARTASFAVEFDSRRSNSNESQRGSTGRQGDEVADLLRRE